MSKAQKSDSITKKIKANMRNNISLRKKEFTGISDTNAKINKSHDVKKNSNNKNSNG